MELKLKDDAFIGDIKALIRPEEPYDQEMAYEKVRTELLELLR